MERIYRMGYCAGVLVLCVCACASSAWSDEETVATEGRTITVGGRSFEVPASRVSAEPSAAFEAALADLKRRFAEHAPLSIVGSRITDNTAITPGSITRAVTDNGRTQRISIAGSTADVANPVAGQRVVVANALMEYRAAQGTQPAGWADITNQGARAGSVACNVTIGSSTTSVAVVDRKPINAPQQGEPTTVVYGNMVYQWQAGTDGSSGQWKNITYSVVPAANVQAGSYEQAILVEGDQARALIVTQVPAAEGSEYVVLGTQVYKWDDGANTYNAVIAGTGEDSHPKILEGAVSAIVRLSNGTEVEDVPVFGGVPSSAGADNGDICIVRNIDTGRESVYIFDAESNAWQRSIATLSLSAKIDRASMAVDVTIDGVVHEDAAVVMHLPQEHTQGRDIIVVRNLLGKEKVYQWDEESKKWTRLDDAPELGHVYQQFKIDLPGEDFSGTARLVASTDEIERPRQGLIVAVTDATGNAAKLYRYNNGEWKLIKEL
ncbi:MAG: hypothetical protein PHS64_04540 [Candidatus Omnitrophica bacterium]|nr:hypothetical protein [Candidatus Omnitrophota bacterium]MDD5775190.1 hypothetical protein [Candidatus Omnitrophota bacterium]